MKLAERVDELATNVDALSDYLEKQEHDIYVNAKDISRWFTAIRDDLTCAYNDEPIYHEVTTSGHARKPGESINAAHNLTTAEYQKQQVSMIRIALPPKTDEPNYRK